MPTHWQVLAGPALVTAIAGMVGCAPMAGSSSTGDVDTVLECSAADIHHVFRIHAATHAVEDVSASPPTVGSVEITPTEYRLLFQDPRDYYELMVQVDRATGRGTRHLFDEEQTLVQGHGGNDAIVCTERGSVR